MLFAYLPLTKTLLVQFVMDAKKTFFSFLLVLTEDMLLLPNIIFSRLILQKFYKNITYKYKENLRV